MSNENALEVARRVLRDLHRAAILREEKYTSAQIARDFVAVARGLDELQADDVRDAIYENWATRDGDSTKKRAVRALEADGQAFLVRYARNGQSGTKPLRLFTLSETQNTAGYFLTAARQFAVQADRWSEAEKRHLEHPELALGDVLDPAELQALADVTREADAA